MKRHTAVWAALAAAILAALGPPASGQMRAIREDAGATAHQSIAGNGLPIDLVADAYGRAWTIQAVGTCGLYAEDAAHTSGETGQLIFAIRTNTRASLSGATGDYTPLQLTANGDLRVRDDDAIVLLGGGLPAALGAHSALTIEGVASGTPVPVSGTVTANIGTAGTLALEAGGNLAAAATSVAQNTRGSALVAITKDTWTALSGIGTQRRLLLNCRTVTASNTATLTIWGSDDGGTTYFPMLLSTGAKARDVSIAVGTDRIGAGHYADAVEILVGPGTHIYVQEEAVGTDDFTYEAGGI